MKKFLLALLILGLPMVGRALPPPSSALSVNLTSRNLQNTLGDALGFNIPAWPVAVQSGGVLEFQSGSTLKIDSGAILIGSTAIPGGTNTQVQFNNNGVFGGTVVSWNGTNLTGLTTPLNASDAANKGYVDSAAAGLIVRTAVAVATTGNITLSGEQTIDGVLTSASRILVKNQTLSQNNGIYATAAGAWSRASDSNTAATLKVGYYYFVSAGTTQGSTGWTITTAPVTLGTDPVVFGQFSASAAYAAGTGLSLVGNTFSVNASQPGITSLGTLNGLTNIGNNTSANFVANAGSGASVAINSGSGTSFLYYNSDLTVAKNGTGNALVIDTNRNIFIPSGNLAVTGNLSSTGEFKASYGLFSGVLAAYDAPGGAVYVGYGASTGIIRSVADNSGSYAPLSIQLGNGTQVGNFTSSGLTLSGTLAVDTNTHRGTTKSNLNVIETNVLDSGADPTGVSDSSAGLTAAVAALPATNGCLLIPPGKYLWNSSSTFTISGKTNLTIIGEGATLYDNNTAAGRPFVTIDKTCSYVKVIGLHFAGNASSRVGGAHQFIVNSDHTQVEFCTFTNGSQFTFYIGSDSTHVTTDVTVSNCQVYNTWADGFHVFNVARVVLADCSTDTTGDDGIGIGSDDSGSHVPVDVTLNNFNAIQAGNVAGGGTHGLLHPDLQRGDRRENQRWLLHAGSRVRHRPDPRLPLRRHAQRPNQNHGLQFPQGRRLPERWPDRRGHRPAMERLRGSARLHSGYPDAGDIQRHRSPRPESPDHLGLHQSQPRRARHRCRRWNLGERRRNVG